MSASEDSINKADFFLQEVPNVKISNNVVKAPPKHVKEELPTIALDRKTLSYLTDTIKFVHGEDFVVKTADAYTDHNLGNLNHKYWQERGNLIIKGCTNYSNAETEPESEADRLKAFALLRLESYGFHSEHCIEALEYTGGEMKDALKLLYEKYFKIKRPEVQAAVESSAEELSEHRVDEKAVLESIYETDFVEKVTNSVWVVKCKLDYLLKPFAKVKEVARVSHVKKKPLCRFYAASGSCKYGNNCRFMHEDERTVKPDVNGHLSDYKFELEVYFPPETKYPFEAPLLFLKTNASVFPPLYTLHICKRLYEEAQNLATDGIASVYSLVELLHNEEEINEFLKNNRINFLSPDERLFPTEIQKNELNHPTRFAKGSTNKNSQISDLPKLLSIDKKLSDAFKLKQDEAAYKKMQATRATLPAYSYKKKILETLATHQAVIISGETGCGKSTQVAQYILDEWLENFNTTHVEIICTQPRRISAIGVAERVSAERTEKIGNSIGYQIRLENKISSSTRLTFCTTGILLRKLELDPLLKNVTHVIVDEVHERSEESDFLLLLLRDLLPLRPDLKVILMSATLNAVTFSSYLKSAPSIEIPGRTFPVSQIFLEEILETTDYVLELDSAPTRNVKDLEAELAECEVNLTHVKPKDIIKDENLKLSQLMARYDVSLRTCKNLFLMDPERVNLDLVEHVLEWICFGEHEHPKNGCVLIFMPGISEITALHDQLQTNPKFSSKGEFLLLPLHSSLSTEDQAKVFNPPKGRQRKIVISTNIAETSVTIEDCVFVIDAGKMKEKHFDSQRNMESLETVWVSRANAMQRKGRAGRVTSGVCIHLYTSHRFKHHFLGQPIPEIHRVPLEQLLLKIKVQPNFKNRDVYSVLGNILEPPVKESIDSAVLRLQHVGALDHKINLTPLGHHLAFLPVDVRVGKLILFGAIFSCVDSALTIAACVSHKSPFVTPFGKKEAAQKKKNSFSNGYGDQATMLNAYKKFQEVSKKSYAAGLNFARENYMSYKTLETIADIKYQFLELLIDIGFIQINLNRKPKGGDHVLRLTGDEFNQNGSNYKILSSILCAALYPNIAKILRPEKSYVASAAGAVLKQIEAKELKYRTKHEQVFVHPSSVLFVQTKYSSPFMVYQEKVKTSKIFIRDCCTVPAVPLVLFSGCEVDVCVRNGATFLVLDDKWIIFRVEEHRMAELLKLIREDLFALLEEKIKDPLMNIHHGTGERIISTIIQLVTTD